jgi:diguanylate cyclase (GGDEF)-like protein
MQYRDLIDLLEHVGKDPSRLIFEDELTGIHNRRFFLSYLEHKVHWERDDDFPLSLLMVDLDAFKEINDSHGHETGDQVLLWLATLLREVGGDQGLPIRYGGDEFMLLLPRAGRGVAREMAHRLLQRLQDRPFRLRDADVTVPVSMSIGFATAPEDAASAKDLFQAADTALFYAKQSGRNQAASAADVDPRKVFPKTALYRLRASGIAGRDEEMATISQALDALTRGRSEFVILEAGPGMGKSTFLEAVRRNLAGDDTFCTARVAGDPQEAYRPYYLVSRILLALLNQRDDKGAEVLAELSKADLAHLSRIVPQLGEAGLPTDGDSARRQGIFVTLVQILPRLADLRPLVLLVDDLHFADEASLLLLRALFRRSEPPVLVCGASVETLKLGSEAEAGPLERFCAARGEELKIRHLRLKPLGQEGIGEYLRAVFPRLSTPPGFEAELAAIVQGNPLFLGEIVRKLVMDRKVTLVGQDWVIERVEEGYLPRSLEEIVRAKIAALDSEDRAILERASTLGEGVSLSVLAGSAELAETQVLEFLDRAEDLGLIRLDFQINDEVMRFLGKRVLEITYGAIDQNRRRELHTEVGDYQERLYQRRLLPSASLLAYHFKRSANQEKARRYEQVQLSFGQSVFDADEAVNYSDEVIEAEAETERRLSGESLPRLPFVLRTFMSAVRNIQLYPPESKTIAEALREVHDAIDAILKVDERLHLAQAQRALLANGQRIDVSRFGMLARSFIDLLTRAELQGIVFKQDLSQEELRALLMALGLLKLETIDQGFWRSFSLDHDLRNIELRQVRYSRLRRKKGRVAVRQPPGEEEPLGPVEMAEIPKILRHLQGAAQNAKLYPLESKQVHRSIEQLHAALHNVLSRRQLLTLSRAEQSLLANGAKLDTTGYAPLATSVLELFDSAGLTSISFSASLPLSELSAFIAALKDRVGAGGDGFFWDDFARAKGLASIAFNQRQYALGVVESLLGAVEVEVVEEAEEDNATARLATEMAEGPVETLRDALPRFGKDLLIRGEHKLLRRLLQRLFENFSAEPPAERELVVLACRALLDGLILGLQHKFTELAADPLLAVLAGEREPRVLQELSSTLYEMSSSCLYFADHQLAARILMGLKAGQQQLERENRESLARLLERRLDNTALELLKEDFKSGKEERQERAAQVVGSLGRSATPLLIQIIKEERDYRVRQLAASLLAELGPGAAEQIKRALATEVTVEQRFRILEVIDTVTHDLRSELAYALGDSSAKIRRAAFRLFERLHRDDLIDTILPLAREEEASVARGAIRSLAHLRSAAALEALISIIDETEDPRVAIACCQALGELGQAPAIAALARVLGQRKPPFLRRRWDDQVRATAALALRQMADPKAAAVLRRHAKDGSARVRQICAAP